MKKTDINPFVKWFVFWAFLLIIAPESGFCLDFPEKGSDPKAALKETVVPLSELAGWKCWGQGESLDLGTQYCLKEAPVTKGVMIVSPKVYGDSVVVKFRTLALTSATVFVVMLSVADPGDPTTLTLPEDYDGDNAMWTSQKPGYFFAFKNAPHGVTPFVRKNPNAVKPLITAPADKMIPGQYYDVEVGQLGRRLYLKIDGEMIFETEDPEPLQGGHIALRLRGVAGFQAACLIKDFRIYTR